MTENNLILFGIVLGAVELSFIALCIYIIWKNREILNITYKNGNYIKINEFFIGFTFGDFSCGLVSQWLQSRKKAILAYLSSLRRKISGETQSCRSR
jgi:ABC-type Fe3+-siderophore transport system permease subunit